MNPFTRNVGVLLAYVGGAYLDYSVIPYVFISLPIIFLIIFGLLPNTPQYLLAAGRIEVSAYFFIITYLNLSKTINFNLTK